MLFISHLFSRRQFNTNYEHDLLLNFLALLLYFTDKKGWGWQAYKEVTQQVRFSFDLSLLPLTNKVFHIMDSAWCDVSSVIHEKTSCPFF